MVYQVTLGNHPDHPSGSAIIEADDWAHACERADAWWPGRALDVRLVGEHCAECGEIVTLDFEPDDLDEPVYCAECTP